MIYPGKTRGLFLRYLPWFWQGKGVIFTLLSVLVGKKGYITLFHFAFKEDTGWKNRFGSSVWQVVMGDA